ncbi:MAG: OmpA family protein [Candidatus Eisenbacteria bacterium]
MRRKHLFGLSCLLVMVAAPVFAAPPQSAAHVDPQAPCYRWPAVDMDGDGVFDRVDHCVNTPPGCTVDEWGCEHDADGDGVCDGVDICPNTPEGVKVDKRGCPLGMVEAYRSAPPPSPPKPEPKETTPAPPATPPPSGAEAGLLTGVIRLDNVYFETGKATLLPDSRTQLDELGLALKKHPELRCEVDGHTDSRGSAKLNRRLSQERADAVRQYLIDNDGIDPNGLVAVGYGESKLLVNPERNDEDRARNRRVEIRVLNPEVLPKGVKIEK